MSGLPQVGDRLANRFEVFDVHLGGIGLVALARDLEAPRGSAPVALKTLRPEVLDVWQIRERFATECKLWIRLGVHPNVVRAFAVESIDGRPFVRLEGVIGGDLRRWIGTPRLDLPRALRFGIDFCLGMEHAIRSGLGCHRDIKPANLLVDSDGTLKVADFGLARLRDDILSAGWLDLDAPIPLADAPTETILPLSSSTPDRPSHAPPARGDDSTISYAPGPAILRFDDGSTLPARITGVGALLGTLPYMAPEQFADPHNVDVRADIYAFGVVLHQMIRNALPFCGGSLARWRRQHEKDTPPSVAPAIPKRYRKVAMDLDTLVGRCLAKDPADRFASMADLRRGLTRLAEEVSRSGRWWR